ncbi:MAG: hypothetical protein Q7R54_02155 [bacterium]|nr:hypothetical protein [bacterium]
MRRTLSIHAIALALFFIGASIVSAQESEPEHEAPPGITFPISELGDCTSQDACKAYCENSAHQSACFSFAEAHNLMSKQEIERARKFSGITGPGGCKGPRECKAYCADTTHQEECLTFAKEHGLEVPHENQPEGVKNISPEVRQIIAEGGGPGGCSDGDSCKAYCDANEHHKECLEFGHEHKMMSDNEYERAQKFVGKPGPGGCNGEACKDYCEDKSHRRECFAFAKENGLISEEDERRAEALEGGGPGGCRGEACKDYCEDPANRETCFAFAVEKGFISKEEADHSKEFYDKVGNEPGPGGCTGNDCRTYCEDSEHREACQQFTKERGVMHEGPPEEMRNAAGYPNEERRMENRPYRPDMKTPEGWQAEMPPGVDNSNGPRGIINPSGHEMRPDFMPIEGNRGMMMERPKDERVPYDNYRPQNDRGPRPEEGFAPPPGDMRNMPSQVFESGTSGSFTPPREEMMQGQMNGGEPPPAATNPPPSDLGASVFSAFLRLLGF